MSVNLMFRNGDETTNTAGDWAAITAVSKTDATSRFPTEGYVSVDAVTIVALAGLLCGAVLSNGTVVSTYDFSDHDDGRAYVEAHVNSFGPSLLSDTLRSAVRDALSGNATAVAMFDVIVARGLQLSLSTDVHGVDFPHLKGVNWIADEVDISMSGGNMNEMMRNLGLGQYANTKESVGEMPVDVFVKAVNDNGPSWYSATGMDKLGRFIACAKRHNATHVYWA